MLGCSGETVAQPGMGSGGPGVGQGLVIADWRSRVISTRVEKSLVQGKDVSILQRSVSARETSPTGSR